MIRDPSDGTVKSGRCCGTPEKFYCDCKPPVAETGPVIDTSTSGLPITKAKAEYLARLEWSRHWIDLYRKAVLDVNRMNDKGEIPKDLDKPT